MGWQVRRAKVKDTTTIVELARGLDTFLMPYVLNSFVVDKYIDQFMVAERVTIDRRMEQFIVEGAVHYLSFKDKRTAQFLLLIKQVPSVVVTYFFENTSKSAFLGQIVCPGKGSFYAILEELKSQYDELWCWMSEVGPSYKSYERYGFQFFPGVKFWNVYKCDYSTFVVGKWRKEK